MGCFSLCTRKSKGVVFWCSGHIWTISIFRIMSKRLNATLRWNCVTRLQDGSDDDIFDVYQEVEHTPRKLCPSIWSYTRIQFKYYHIRHSILVYTYACIRFVYCLYVFSFMLCFIMVFYVMLLLHHLFGVYVLIKKKKKKSKSKKQTELFTSLFPCFIDTYIFQLLFFDNVSLCYPPFFG